MRISVLALLAWLMVAGNSESAVMIFHDRAAWQTAVGTGVTTIDSKAWRRERDQQISRTFHCRAWTLADRPSSIRARRLTLRPGEQVQC